MAFKLKKSADQLFHRIAESKHNGGEATSQPMLNTGTPMKPDGGPKMKMEGGPKMKMEGGPKMKMAKGPKMKMAKGPKMAPDSVAKLGPLGAAYATYKMVKGGKKLVESGVNKVKQTLSDYNTGKATRKKAEATKATSKSSGSGSYAKAAKKDPNLASYIKQRKGLDKGSNEYKKLQNKINAAYGVSKRYDVSEGGSGDGAAKPKVTKVQAAKINVKKAKVDAKKSVGSARANKLNVKSEVAREAGKTKKADRIAKRAERTQKRAERGGSKVGVAVKGIFRKKQK
jgi:hypothetical protein